MAQRKAIETGRAPKAIGPYSQAIQSGDFLFVSGQLGIDPDTGKLVEGGAAGQAQRALENVRAILTEAGYDFGDVVQSQVFLSDISDFAKVNEVYKTYFKEPYPARAAIQAGALPLGAAVEILVTAKK